MGKDRILTNDEKEYIKANISLPCKELAKDLEVSEVTVYNYVRRLRERIPARDYEKELEEVEKKIQLGDLSPETLDLRNRLAIRLAKQQEDTRQDAFLSPIHVIN